MNTVFLNGRFVPENEAVIPVMDRGFMYGDGLFETMRVHRRQVFRWREHLERFQRGLELLVIPCPISPRKLKTAAGQLIESNALNEAVLRLHLSRGIGARGYSTQGATSPTLVMTLHPLPRLSAGKTGWSLHTAAIRINADTPLLSIKSANKLLNILARAEAEARGADEALMLNSSGNVVEAASGNLFIVSDGCLITPPRHAGILPGITRDAVFELANGLGIAVGETNFSPKQILGSRGAFLTMSSFGILPVDSLDGVKLKRSAITERLRTAYAEMLDEECGTGCARG